MLKLFVIFLVFLSQSEALKIVKSEAQTTELRIASGYNFKNGENKDFCYLTANFIEKQKTCGCYIRTYEQVITSARCVYE